jgi:hypothetical protein
MSTSLLEAVGSKVGIGGPVEGVRERDAEREIDLEATEPTVG